MTPEEKSGETKAEAGGKKPYSKPQIVYRQRLEAMAAVCSGSVLVKTSSGGGFPCSWPYMS